MKKATFQQLAYLDDLRESGVTNMCNARKYLRFEFPELDEQAGSEVLAEWFGSLNLRHPDPALVVEMLSDEEIVEILASIMLIKEVIARHLDRAGGN